MALTIMLYHYTSWTLGNLGGDSLLGKLGIYGVAIFYILSGASLTIAYQGKISAITDIKSYAAKRFFRIAPLFWLVVTITLLLIYIKCRLDGTAFNVSSYIIFLNYSLLFGFIDPTAYFSTGAWSIGNEIVFYAIFPFILIATKYNHKLIWPIFILSIAIGLFFALHFLDKTTSLANQWHIYVNPFNQLFLFIGGISIVIFSQKYRHLIFERLPLACMLVGIIFFYTFPGDADNISLVSGLGRIILSVACILFVFGMINHHIKTPKPLARILTFLGEHCYSIYLLHPIVAIPVVSVIAHFGGSKLIAYIISACLTFILSAFTFKYIETPMISYGSRISKKISIRTT
ncbi:hypothetical protein A7981_07065 [Methylovorus sp. MM2]|nr:hypothetical protein A7981_07065 [Methylovorus sp. MM2]